MDIGTLPQWLSGVGTVGAFSFAAWTYRRGENEKRKAQARLVHALPVGDAVHILKGRLFKVPLETDVFDDEYAKIVSPAENKFEALVDLWISEIEIHNGSDEVISEMWGFMLNLDEDQPSPSLNGPQTMRPHETISRFVIYAYPPTPGPGEIPDRSPIIYFRDSAGLTWKRVMGTPVEEEPFYADGRLRDRWAYRLSLGRLRSGVAERKKERRLRNAARRGLG